MSGRLAFENARMIMPDRVVEGGLVAADGLIRHDHSGILEGTTTVPPSPPNT